MDALAVANRLVAIRHILGIKKIVFAKKIKITNAFLSQIENPGSRSVALTVEIAMRIQKEYFVNAEWLIFGEGKPLIEGLEFVAEKLRESDK